MHVIVQLDKILCFAGLSRVASITSVGMAKLSASGLRGGSGAALWPRLFPYYLRLLETYLVADQFVWRDGTRVWRIPFRKPVDESRFPAVGFNLTTDQFLQLEG